MVREAQGRKKNSSCLFNILQGNLWFTFNNQLSENFFMPKPQILVFAPYLPVGMYYLKQWFLES